MKTVRTLPYQPETLARELKRHYISASEKDIQEMLAAIGNKDFSELFNHLPEAIRFETGVNIPEELSYQDLKKHLEDIAEKNKTKISFLGSGLPAYRVPEIVPYVLGIRELTTSYTPYQPERSQGTLLTHWIYQCLLASLTGFEAVNSSLYDRASALFEAIQCARRLVKNETADTIVILESIYPGDLQVIKTMAEGTSLKIVTVPYLPGKHGETTLTQVKEHLQKLGSQAFGLVYPQVNACGILEDVHGLTDLAHEFSLQAIAMFDPMQLAKGGLISPSQFGKEGADLIVGEGQHLAILPNFGGPGLGIFGIRFNENHKNGIRATSGRFVGKAKDNQGRECRVMVLSTREQHIRREKANSNICSNEAFIATLAGAALLERGDHGMEQASAKGRQFARLAFNHLTTLSGVEAAFPEGLFYNEIVLRLPIDVNLFIKKASDANIQVGRDVSSWVPQGKNLLLISFTDLTGEKELQLLFNFFESLFGKSSTLPAQLLEIPQNLIRQEAIGIPKVTLAELKTYYTTLGSLNVSPDSACYPLGSCTMKYNPYINDYAAGLSEFQNAHPDALEENIQGVLEIIYQTQEYFKAITGLQAVTTQPVAGAQGELVGLKLFQAYHRDRKEDRDIVLIPRSAHGTNPATATMAGFDKEGAGVILIEAESSTGEMDLGHLKELIEKYGKRVAGMMVTNPNTSGLFETKFQQAAMMIHAAGGLVYMDGANMNAICGWANLGKMGVDAVHNNTHKTWSIPHGGGGPGDAFVAVSEKLIPFLPGIQVVKEHNVFHQVVAPKSIGSFHRHQGNFAHKVRAYTYLATLGKQGVRRISAMAVLSARYLQKQLEVKFPMLPLNTDKSPRMHEFILTLPPETFKKVEAVGITHAQVISRMGKLFLDFGFHAPTVSFPEALGLMIEPTESYTKGELDRFGDAVLAMLDLVNEHPEVLLTVPHFTPIDRVDEVTANKNLVLSEKLTALPNILSNRLSPQEIEKLSFEEIKKRILAAHLQVKK